MSPAFEVTPGWLVYHPNPSIPRFKVPAGAVDAPVCRQRLVGTHSFEHHLLALRDRLRIRELGECRQRYAQLAQALVDQAFELVVGQGRVVEPWAEHLHQALLHLDPDL